MYIGLHVKYPLL